MPKVEVEIMMTRRPVIEEQGTVVLNVPQKFIDNDTVQDWIDGKYGKGDDAFDKLIDDAMEEQSNESDTEFTEAYVLA